MKLVWERKWLVVCRKSSKYLVHTFLEWIHQAASINFFSCVHPSMHSAIYEWVRFPVKPLSIPSDRKRLPFLSMSGVVSAAVFGSNTPRRHKSHLMPITVHLSMHFRLLSFFASLSVLLKSPFSSSAFIFFCWRVQAKDASAVIISIWILPPSESPTFSM